MLKNFKSLLVAVMLGLGGCGNEGDDKDDTIDDLFNDALNTNSMHLCSYNFICSGEVLKWNQYICDTPIAVTDALIALWDQCEMEHIQRGCNPSSCEATCIDEERECAQIPVNK